jgi:hypothetical protein
VFDLPAVALQQLLERQYWKLVGPVLRAQEAAETPGIIHGAVSSLHGTFNAAAGASRELKG